MTVINHQIDVFRKTDGMVINTVPLQDFFTPQPVSPPFDPRIVYDYKNKRFLIVTVIHNTATDSGYLGVIVSRHDTPSTPNDWCSLRFYPGESQQYITFLDSPGISIDPEADTMFLTANLYDYQSPTNRIAQGARIFKSRLSDVEGCLGAGVVESPRIDIPNSGGRPAESFRPTQWFSGTTSLNAYFLSHDLPPNSTVGTTLYLWSLENTVASTNLPTLTQIATPYEKSPGLRQIGSVNTIQQITTPWILEALYKGDKIYATQDVKHRTANAGASIIYVITPGVGANAIYREKADTDYGYQSIMFDAFNNMAAIFNYTQTTSPTVSIGIGISGLTLRTTLVQNSTAIMSGTRSGDYAGSALDPDGKTIWMIHQYIEPNDLWQTKIIAVTFLPLHAFIPLVQN